jgi:hypothetical protein
VSAKDALRHRYFEDYDPKSHVKNVERALNSSLDGGNE